VSRIVVAENLQHLQFSNGHLRDVRHEIVRLTVGVFTDATTDVSADWIEVAKGNDVPALEADKF
jgi:hypothetical protein